MEEKFICCICGRICEGYGNNPDGAMWMNGKDEIVEPSFKENERCCDKCNASFVIPGRMNKYCRQKNKEEK